MTEEYRVWVPGQVIPDDKWFTEPSAAIKYAETVRGAIVECVYREVIYRNDVRVPR